jgi:hypothetical protein
MPGRGGMLGAVPGNPAPEKKRTRKVPTHRRAVPALATTAANSTVILSTKSFG